MIDGLFMEGSDASSDLKQIKLTHKSPTYENLTFKFDDQEEYSKILLKLAYLNK